ncbi:MAG: RidA family protein [Actinomycetota bacterium]|nr:RidA family protein [Actinomycetota bacterium]
MTAVAVNPPDVHPVPAYSHALVRRGTPVFLTGQIALDASGQLVGRGDPAAQAAQVWRNIGSVVAALGADMGDIVKLTTYAVDLGHLSAIGAERAKHFEPGRFPASTFLVVAGLAHPDYLVEIEATVMLDDAALEALG